MHPLVPDVSGSPETEEPPVVLVPLPVVLVPVSPLVVEVADVLPSPLLPEVPPVESAGGSEKHPAKPKKKTQAKRCIARC